MRRRKIMELKSIKVKDAFAEFIEEHRAKNTSKNTLDTYTLHINCFIEVTECDLLSTASLDKGFYTYFITALQEEGVKKDTTIASYCRSVRAFLYWLMDNNYMQEESLKLPKYDKTVKETYTREEITTLLEKPDKGCSEVTYQTWVFINLIMSTGLRLSSALNLKVSDFVKRERILYVQKTKQRKGQQIYLNEDMCNILNKYIQQFELDLSDYIFCIGNRDIMKKRTMEDNVATYNRARGVQKTSIHLMRHTFAKNYYEKTKDIYSLQQILGHSTITTTENYIRDLGLTPSNSVAYNPQQLFTASAQQGMANKRRSRKMQ